MARSIIAVFTTTLALGGCAGVLFGAPISVPNNSFESPVTPFVSLNVDSWQKAPMPDGYGDTNSWNTLVGLFKNDPPGMADHIDNCDGNQAIWLFVVPQAALFQDYDSIDWRSPEPGHAFDATFEVGKSYQLTVGISAPGGAMPQGVTMELSLYYRDTASNLVAVAATSITNTVSIFITNTHFIDFQVGLPMVRPTDPWAGQHIGIQMLSTVDPLVSVPDLSYWDLDNVRLTSTLEPVLQRPAWANNYYQFTLQSEPGLAVEILSASDLTLPRSNWTSLGILTNISGTTPFSDTAASTQPRYYCARRLP